MIANEREYRITKARAAEFARAVEKHSAAESRLPAAIRKAQRAAMESQLGELRSALKEYEVLRTGRRQALQVQSLEDLPQVLIQARIASGLSQFDLAERLGLQPQQIQRYEATRYASASLARVESVAKALEITVKGRVELKRSRPAARSRRS